MSDPDGRIDRISDRAVFRRFRGARARARSGPIQVVMLPRPATDRPAVAFAISRRVGTAVVRNRVRRRLRVAARAAAAKDLLSPGWYLLIIGPDAAGATMTTLSDHLVKALQRLPVDRPGEA